jgi:hypothetical protein
MDPFTSVENSHVDVLHEIGVRLATADGFREVLTRVVHFAPVLVKCDSCLIYVLEGDELSCALPSMSGQHATGCFARPAAELVAKRFPVWDKCAAESNAKNS